MTTLFLPTCCDKFLKIIFQRNFGFIHYTQKSTTHLIKIITKEVLVRRHNDTFGLILKSIIRIFDYMKFSRFIQFA